MIYITRYIFIIKKLFQVFSTEKLNSPIKKVTETGIKISFIALLFSVLLMTLYIDYKPSKFLFEASSLLVHSFSMFIVYFLVLGVSFNKLQKGKNN
ncbi:hypothetical protein [Candidatus Ruminimicrobium bovinum]|uniref:hypothetical protein n=1 Tax=Candidatus Ruminimicrobium bovinum TaxID=3242779 RepID=UPI0039B8E351